MDLSKFEGKTITVVMKTGPDHKPDFQKVTGPVKKYGKKGNFAVWGTCGWIAMDYNVTEIKLKK